MKLKFCTNYGNKKINKKLIVGGYSSSTVIYLIVGQNGVKYSTTSIQKIIKNSALKSGIYKKVTPHNLQYSFATHLLENRTDIRLIQTIRA